MSLKKVIFVADFFAGQILGGAELHDSVVENYFKSVGCLHGSVNCRNITPDYIKDNSDKMFFISNFASLSLDCIVQFIQTKNYIIYEHDYKFLKTRNPINFVDFVAPKQEIINFNFYKNAKKVICLSEKHREIFDKNLRLDNIVNINCSMWADDDLDFIESISGNTDRKENAIIKSSNPTKKTLQTIEFCKRRGIDFDLISSSNYREFLSILSNYENLYFMTGHPEPTPRIAIEAKMLGVKFISNKRLICVAHEDYFNLEGAEMVTKVRELRNIALDKLTDWINND